MTDTITPGGLNSTFIAAQLPGWVKHATGKDLKRLRNTQLDAQFTPAGSAAWFTQADESQQATLTERQESLRHSTRGLAGLLKHLKSITDFAEPLLTARLKADYGLEVDVNTAQLSTVSREWTFNDRWQAVTVKSQSLLQAALQNFAASASFSADDCLSLEGNYTVINEVIREPAILSFDRKLAITPQQFATLCHSLDLGGLYQKHLSQVFDTPLTSSRVRYRSIEVNKALLRVQLSIARMKSEISTAGHDALLSLLDDNAALTFHGSPAKCLQVTLYGIPLNDVWILSAEHKGSDGLKPVIVYLPGAPLYPLKEYPSIGAFKNDLRTSLRQPVYTELLLGYVAKSQQPELARLLQQNLYHEVVGPSDAWETVFNPDASLKLRPVPVGGNLFKAVQDQHVVRVKEDARSLVVPSSEADANASAERLAYWENLGLNVANVAAMLVPVLGEVMAGVMAEQLIREAIEGAESWSNGDRVTAWAHLEALSINIAIAAGLAVAGTLKPNLDSSLVLDELVHVELPSGEKRLWRPALEPYARKDIDLAELMPDTKGMYAVGDKRYVRIEARTYEVYQEPAGEWRIDPGVDELYRPQLSSYGEGAWLAYGERPMIWTRQQLLRRLGYATDGLTDLELSNAAEISGVSDDVLREVHMQQTRMPARLADTLRRMRLQRQVTHFIATVADGTAKGRNLGYLPALATRLPHWPEQVIEVFEGPERWGDSTAYGRKRWPIGSSIKLTKTELYEGKLAQTIIDALDEERLQALLGERTLPTERLAELRKRLAGVVSQERGKVFESLYSSDESQDLGIQRIRKDFPSLPEHAAREIVASAKGSDRRILYGTGGKVPLRIAEEARVYQRQARVSRAVEGMYEPNLASLDSDTLAVALLPTLPGWTGRVRLELRVDTLSGKLAQTVGDSDGVLKRLVRTDTGHEAFDEQGVSLGSARSVMEATLKALPDSERTAIEYNITEGQRLGATLRTEAAGDRERVARVLGMTPRRPWFFPPLDLGDGRVGYPLGGAGRVHRSHRSRLLDLFPRMSLEARDAYLARLEVLSLDAEAVISRLEAEWKKLRKDLNKWVNLARDQELELEFYERSLIEEKLTTAWRERGENVLDLSNHRVDSLPVLTASFAHITLLKMNYMALDEVPAGFFGAFPALTELQLQSNLLIELPASLARCPRLERLDLSNNLIAANNTMLASIRETQTLRTLDLGSNGLHHLPDSALLDLAGLRSLETLSLSNNGLSLNAAGLRRLVSVPLRNLDLSRNLIVLDEAAAAAFEPAVNMERLVLFNNPLVRPPSMAGMTRLSHLDLGRCRLSAWPADLTALMDREQFALRHVELSHNAIRSLPDFSATRFGQARARGNVLHLDLRANPLLPEAEQRLTEIGLELPEQEEGIDPYEHDPARVWLEGASEARRQTWQLLQDDELFRPAFNALGALAHSEDASRYLESVRERVWSVLEFASQNQAFREELIEITKGFPVTCGDMGADLFSDFEIAQLVYQDSMVAGTESANRRALNELYGKLFCRSEVNRLADRISLKRTLRVSALNAGKTGTQLPALDPLDVITDELLLVPPTVDDVEVRLKLRLALKDTLGYPEATKYMRFDDIAKVSPEVVDNVRDEIRAHETEIEPREAWLVEQTSWLYYLKQHYKARFDVLDEAWGAGSAYLYECNGEAPLTITTLDKHVIDTLRPSLGDRIVNDQGVMQKVNMNGAEYTIALNALREEQVRATEQLIKDLTHAQVIS